MKKVLFLMMMVSLVGSYSMAGTCEEDRANQYATYRASCSALNQTDPNTPPNWYSTCVLSAEPYANLLTSGYLIYFNQAYFPTGGTPTFS